MDSKWPKPAIRFAEAEKRHRRELQQGFNSIEDTRAARIRTIHELGWAFLDDYKLRHPHSATFAIYAVRNIVRLLGKNMAFDLNEDVVKAFQITRLKENAAAKTINQEIGFFSYPRRPG